MIQTIQFNGRKYPKFQSEGFAAKFIIPFALEVCKGYGYDIGCGKVEWQLPGSIGIDPAIHNNYAAMALPAERVEYIFSSHCLEHLPNWVAALEYWKTHLTKGGTLFLYLPHPDQEYWLPWNNRKHIHILYPKDIEKYLLESGGWTNVFVSERDLNHSFCAIAEKI